MVSKHLTKDSAKGPALDWSRYIKARDLVDCKAANVPIYSMQELPCFESFVIDDNCDGGWIYDRISFYVDNCQSLAQIVELDELCTM